MRTLLVPTVGNEPLDEGRDFLVYDRLVQGGMELRAESLREHGLVG